MTRASRRPPQARRDQAESAFAAILGDLVDRVPGVRAAALVDIEGETVDYASHRDPFEVRLAAAHLRIVLRELEGPHASACTLVLRGVRRSYVAATLPQGYALVLVLTCGAATATAGRALAVCKRRLADEAGWDAPARLAWQPVDVQTDNRGKPTGVTSERGSFPVEILGAIARGLARFERGWRVRVAGGEATIVQEPSGHWYMDEVHLIGSTGVSSERPPGNKSR